MSNCYVSQQRGSNSNSGLTPALPKLTLTGTSSAASVATSASDTIFLGPGIYRERPVFLAASQVIQADPLSRYVLGDTPGIVRITGAGTDEKPTSGTVIGSGSYAGCKVQGYLVNAQPFFCQVDGSTGTGLLGTTTNPLLCNYVSVQACVTGYSYCTATGCFGAVSTTAFINCTATDCVGITSCPSANGIYRTSTSTNCLAIGGAYGFTGTGSATNCIALGSSNGFYGSGTGGTAPLTLTNCQAIYCQYGYYGLATANPLIVSSCYATSCQSAQRGSGYESGTPTASGGVLFDAGMIMRAFEPIVSAGTYGLGSGANTDVFGRVDNPCDIGPYNETAATRVWQSNLPKIPRGIL